MNMCLVYSLEVKVKYLKMGQCWHVAPRSFNMAQTGLFGHIVYDALLKQNFFLKKNSIKI